MQGKARRRPHRKSSDPAAASMRQCIVCRQSSSADDLMPVRATGLEATNAAAASPTTGRRAYVCINKGCLAGLQSKMLGRALRTDASHADLHDLEANLHSLSQKRLLELLGLARRHGDLLFGVDDLSELCRHEPDLKEQGWVCIIASDLAERSRRKVQADAFVSASEMGRALGMGSVGAMGIRPGRLAKRAAYWFGVWYETQTRVQSAGNYQQNGSEHDGANPGLIEVA